MEKCDTVVIGAGPYGLSVAAYLKQIEGLDLRVFGEPMSFWERHMPEGMMLRSPREASDLHDPCKLFSLCAFEKATRNQDPIATPSTITEDFILRDFQRKVSLGHFISYGRWFSRKADIAPDHRTIRQVETTGAGYRLKTDDGMDLQTQQVVVAGGVQPFAHKPKAFEGLSAPLVLHTSEIRNPAVFQGKEVMIVGAGQSALETAALLFEAGAHVEVFTRHHVRWFGIHRRWMHERPWRSFLYGRADVGPAGISLLVQNPSLYRYLPRQAREKWGTRAIIPGASNWVMARTRHIPIRENHSVLHASTNGDRIRLRLTDGTDRLFDHAILGTGYRVNIALYPFLSKALEERIAKLNGYPLLDSNFETTLPGLYFVGAPAAWSFGPLMRFVDGTEFTSQTLGRHFRNKKRKHVGS
jgi:FAD-dependent urate hydroxylase